MPEQITLISRSKTGIRPLVQSAIQSELKMLELGLRRTELNIKAFESKYSLTSEELAKRISSGEMAESLDFIEWLGEYKTWQLLQENYRALKEIEIC
jgi:hypothetical protein